MHESAIDRNSVGPGAYAAVAALLVRDCDRDMPLVAIPRAEVQLVARFGPSARNGLDLHVLGAQRKARRKLIRAGQRTVVARLNLGAAEAVVGAPASAVAGRVIVLDDLWGAAATRRLSERLDMAQSATDAAAIMQSAITERPAAMEVRRAPSHLVLQAAARLPHSQVNAVASDLGVSARHLRRLFREAVGMSPKEFASLARFHRALHAAHQDGGANWAGIASAAGYYDQAHLIDEFRAIAGVTPPTLLGELGGTEPGAGLEKAL